MSADKHDLLSRVTQGPLVVEDISDTNSVLRLAVVEPITRGTVAIMSCARDDAEAVDATRADADLAALAYDHALLTRALFSGKARLNIEVRGHASGDVVPPSITVLAGQDRFWAYTVEALDAAGCPVLTEELRAALRKAVGLP